MIVDNYKVSWSHFNNGPKKRNATSCTIVELNDEKEPIPGSALCHVVRCNRNDMYNKAVGRKLSFAKTVNMIRNKEIRTKLWEALKETSLKTVITQIH